MMMTALRQRSNASVEIVTLSGNDDDDERVGLVEKDSLCVKQEEPEHNISPQATAFDDGNDDPLGFSFSIRKFSFLVLGFLVISHLLLARQCHLASAKQKLATEPLVSKWKVTTKHTELMVTSQPHKSESALGYVQPGQEVELIPSRGNSDYYQLLRPMAGFVPKTSARTGKDYFEPVESDASLQAVESSVCPLMYAGWWPEGESHRRYIYAPASLSVAQQLWNAMQVFQLFLLISLVYECNQASCKLPPSMHRWRKILVLFLAFATICILPFSGYLISPGGHIFACITLVSTLLAILTPVSDLRISVGENDEDALGDSDSTPWILSREETIACLCNLGSSLYNYAGSIRTWPHWKRHFYRIDRYFGWPTSGDCSVEEDFTMGLESVRVPLFVSRSTGSTTGAQVFFVVWSVLPFLYVSYFGCMFVLARRSPGVIVQRALCVFGMCHFLFFTDAVAYRYGRGYKHLNEGLFHWFEKWAWRTAILMPIYQNCTNGHWEHGHKRFPILGKVLRWALIFWGIYFFLFQVIQSDVFKFSQFLLHNKQQDLLTILGLSKAPILRRVTYPYRMALVTMILMYGLLHVTGFTLFRIYVRREPRGQEQGDSTDETRDKEEKHLRKGLLSNFSSSEDEDDDGKKEIFALDEL